MRRQISSSLVLSSFLVAASSALAAGCSSASTDTADAAPPGSTSSADDGGSATGSDASTGTGTGPGTGTDGSTGGGQGSAACPSADVLLSPAVLVAEPDLTGTGAKAVAVGDVNKDGKADLVALSAVNTAVALGQGNNAFAAPVAVGGGGNNGGGANVVIADLDGDTWPDLVTFGGVVEYAPNAADGTASFGNYKTIVSNGANFGVVADFNGDGILDVAMTSNQLSVALGSGKGAFAGATTFTGSAGWSSAYGDTGNSVTGFAAGDVDGDGLPDLVLASSSNVSQNNSALGGLCISLNKNHGAMFADPVCYPVPSGFDASSLVLGDFNKDGALDAALGGSGGNAFFQVFLNKGGKTGTFGTATPNASGMTVATSLATADLNNDGNLDLIDFYNAGGMVVVNGNGDGTFATTAAPYAVGNAQNAAQSAALATGIFSSTGLTGIAVVNNQLTSSSAPNGGIQILAGACSQ